LDARVDNALEQAGRFEVAEQGQAKPGGQEVVPVFIEKGLRRRLVILGLDLEAGFLEANHVAGVRMRDRFPGYCSTAARSSTSSRSSAGASGISAPG